jgi:hypothetical protein
MAAPSVTSLSAGHHVNGTAGVYSTIDIHENPLIARAIRRAQPSVDAQRTRGTVRARTNEITLRARVCFGFFSCDLFPDLFLFFFISCGFDDGC